MRLHLIYFLIPITLCANPPDKDLKFNKEVELSDLGKRILEKCEYIEKVRQKAISIMRNEADKKGLDYQQAQEYGKQLDTELVNFRKEYAAQESLTGILSQSLFKISEHEPIPYSFEEVKFCLLIILNEFRILKAFIEKYEALEQEHRLIISEK